jgi:DNA-binding transcriptional LysR family regulator
MFDDLLIKGGLSLDRLQSFCQVAAAGGVTKAARGDSARQSQFSRQIKELEEFFGVELLRRKGRGVALTPAGERLHQLAREQLLALADFTKSCQGQPVQITLAAGDSLIQWAFLPNLQGIRDQLRQVSFRVLNLPTTEIIARLRDGTVDLGLVRDDSVTPALKASVLGTQDFSLFVPNGLVSSSQREALSAKAISSLPLATLEGAGQFRQELEKIAQRQKLSFNIQLEVSSFLQAARAVQTGKFAAILPSMAIAELRGAGVAELKPAFLRPLSRCIALAWNPRMARIRVEVSRAIPVFRELLRLATCETLGTLGPA